MIDITGLKDYLREELEIFTEDIEVNNVNEICIETYSSIYLSDLEKLRWLFGADEPYIESLDDGLMQIVIPVPE